MCSHLESPYQGDSDEYPQNREGMLSVLIRIASSSKKGDSHEYSQNTIFNIYKKITLNYPKSAAMAFFPRES